MEGKNAKKPLFDDIDLLQLVGKLLNKWKLIVKVSICFAVFGFVVALSSI